MVALLGWDEEVLFTLVASSLHTEAVFEKGNGESRVLHEGLLSHLQHVHYMRCSTVQRFACQALVYDCQPVKREGGECQPCT